MAEEKKVTQLSPNRLALAEHAHQTFVATPESGTPFEATLDPKYWAHYSVTQSMQMNTNDMILVKPEDGTYFAELLVREVFKGGVKVVKLRHVELDKADDGDVDAEYTLKYSGPVIKWQVIRIKDNRQLVQGLANKTVARNWLIDHKRQLAA